MKCTKCGFKIPKDSDTCTRCGTPILKRGLSPTRYIKDDFDDVPGLSYAPGDSFGKRYRIEEEIGRGGMGKIYKAWDKDLEIHVAIKMIHPELLSKPDTIQRFKKEILIAREITHENVVRIYDFGEFEGVKFISMQYIDGDNLAELIHASGTLDIETAISVAKQICRGLAAAHNQGIIHRDLKPQNIMIDKKGKVFITDFGLAKSLEEQGISMSGIVMGTPQYLSPEQAMGEKIDQRADIYMLGIIMYEMITGKELFVSETVIGYLQKHIQQKPASPSTINVLIPPFFEKIILKCLEKEKSKRYRSVDELLKDLEKEKVATRPIISSPRARKILKYFAAFLFISLAALAIIYLIFLRPPPPSETGNEQVPIDKKTSVAVMPFEIHSKKKELSYWRETFQDLLITELHQSKYFRILSGRHLYEILRELNILDKNDYTTEELKLVASKGEVSHIIDSELIDTGNVFIVNVKVWEEGSENETPLGFDPVEGVESFPQLVDNMGKKIREVFLSPDELLTDSDEEIGKISTASSKAYPFYIEGKRHYWDGDYQKSNEALEEAITLDPKFAMAYRRLAVNYLDVGQHETAQKYLRKALEFIDRVSKRERYLIRASEYLILKNSTKMAIEEFNQLFENYPDDEEGKISLGAIYRNLEDWELAEDQFKKILEINKNSRFANMNLVYINMARGSLDLAGNLLQKIPDLFSSRDTYHRWLARIFLYQNDYNRALFAINEARALTPGTIDYANIELIGIYNHARENFPEAEKHYKQIIEIGDKSAQAEGRQWLSSLYLMQGKYTQCKEQVKKGLEQCRQNELQADEARFLLFSACLNLKLKNGAAALEETKKAIEALGNISSTTANYIRKFALNLQGSSYLQMKNIGEAKNIAARLLDFIEKSGSKRQNRLYHHLRGKIFQAENKFIAAIDEFEKTPDLIPYEKNKWDDHAFYFDALASAYYENRNYEQAKDIYEQIQALSINRLRWGDIYTRSFYWLGKIYQSEKKKKEAVSQYNKFLQLWQDADPDIPELVDAKKQLEVLK